VEGVINRRKTHMNIRFLGQVVLQVTRPLPEKEDIKDGYIYRGLLVKNFGND